MNIYFSLKSIKVNIQYKEDNMTKMYYIKGY